MSNIIIAGSGTDVGKTVVAAILTTLLKGDYWKPVECGELKDSVEIQKLIDANHSIFPPTYSLKAPLSPHHAARLENCTLNIGTILLPKTTRPLIIEMAGGIFTPLTSSLLNIDLFKTWNAKWVIVSRHYLGSINHTLLTLHALQKLAIPDLSLVFNGEPNPDSEEAILKNSAVPLLGRLLPETHIDLKTIQKYVNLWKKI